MYLSFQPSDPGPSPRQKLLLLVGLTLASWTLVIITFHHFPI